MKRMSKVFIINLIFPAIVLSQSVKDEPGDKTITKEKAPSTKNDSTAIWNNITFLNAANFDFSDNLTGTYLGKLNIYAPDIKDNLFGFNAGIMRIKFNYKDSSNSPIYMENKFNSSS